MSDYQEKLKDIICQGVAVDLHLADEALSLDWFVGQHADEINKATFGAFFGSLQDILVRNLILHLAKIFDTPKRNPIRSIPSAIKILKANGDQLTVKYRPGLILALTRYGASLDEIEKLPDRELTGYLVSFFEQRCAANEETLKAIKTMRDKVVAHHEAVRLEDILKPVYAEIEELLALAHAFISAVGSGYLNMTYEDDDGHWSGDAKRTTTCLNRLLQTAGVLPKRTIPE